MLEGCCSVDRHGGRVKQLSKREHEVSVPSATLYDTVSPYGVLGNQLMSHQEGAAQNHHVKSNARI